MRYFKELDSLRTFAAAIVIISHWLPALTLNKLMPLGQIGVNLFFVLSGYLVTKIILENKRKSEETADPKNSRFGLIKSFYARRSLRIFPIYYLHILLILIFASDETDIVKGFVYYATYTSNFYFFFDGWDVVLGHLWSLAVEEQFYLLWPWLIIFTDKRYTKFIIAAFVAVGVISDIILTPDPKGYILTFSCISALGIGGFVAYYDVHATHREKFFRILSVMAVIAVIGYPIAVVSTWQYIVNSRTVVSVIGAFVIAAIAFEKTRSVPWVNLLLKNPLLVFLGKISYGLYLYHMVVDKFFYRAVNHFVNPLLPSFILNQRALLYLAECSIMLLLVAMLSYYFIEMPFLRLKKRFEY